MTPTNKVYFTEINRLIDAHPGKTNAHKFNLKWSFDQALNNLEFTKIEIYRYIGKVNACVSYVTENDTHSKLIYRVTKLNSNECSIEIIRPSPLNNSTSRQTKQITSYVEVIDNLSSWYNTSSNSLTKFHNLSDALHDEQLLQQIYTSERTIYYLIKVLSKNNIDNAPYCIGAHKDTQIVDCTSTKNQVKHNTLHYEGDYIWQTDCSAAIPKGNGEGMSRTAIDINRLFTNQSHQTPTGYGGYCWISSRDGSNGATVARFNLSNGLNSGIWNSPGQQTTAGAAIAIRLNDGACYSGAGTGNSNGKLYLINNPNPIAEFAIGSTPTLLQSNLGILYGACTSSINGVNKVIFNTRGLSAESGIFQTTSNTLNLLYSFPFTYGIAAGPDGAIYNGFAYSTNGYDGKIYRNGSEWATGGTATGITVNKPIDNNNYTVYFGGDGGGTQTGLWYKVVGSNTQKNIYTGDSARGFGVDTENNIWGLGKKRLKIYHVDQSNAGNQSNTYPYGLKARYPSIPLRSYNDSITNSKGVEWFLTRNYFNLNNTIKVKWDDPITQESLNLTAKEAWIRLIDSRRKEEGNNYFKVWKQPFNSTQYSNYSKQYGIKFKHLVDIEQYSKGVQNTKYSEAYTLIKLWSDLYADPDSNLCYPGRSNRLNIINSNLLGRLIHPNYENTGSYIADRKEDSSRSTVVSYLETIANGSNGSKILTFTNVNGYSYQYSDFTGNLLANAIQESTYSADIIYPSLTVPTLSIIPNAASQANGGYQDLSGQCYFPWKKTIISYSKQFNNYIAYGYDDLTVSFKISASPGSFIIKKWNFTTNNFSITALDNIRYLNNIANYNTRFNTNYTYKDPSLFGIHELPVSEDSDYHTANVSFSATNLYTCETIISESNCRVIVLERWPEPKFFINMSDSESFRRNFFN